MSKKKHQQFLQLYQPVHERFERYCRAHAYGDMPYQDLINETLLVAYQKIETLKKQDAFLSFLIGISIRLLANHKRKRKLKMVQDDIALVQYADPNNVLEQQFKVELLHQALAQLPALQREAIILFEITGFSIKEIMVLQNSGLSAVKQRLARGRVALAKIIKQEMTYHNSEK